MAERCCGRDVTVFGHHHWDCRTARSRAQLARPVTTALRAELDIHALKLGALRSSLANLRASIAPTTQLPSPAAAPTAERITS